MANRVMNETTRATWVSTVSAALKSAKKTGDFDVAVNTLERELTTAAFVDGATKSALFTSAFDAAGLSAQQRKDVIAAFAGSSSVAVSEFLAKEIKGALQAANTRHAQLPDHAREVQVTDRISYITLKPGAEKDPKTWNGVSMFEVPATAWLIPQLASGSAGGAAAGLIRTARDLAAREGTDVTSDPRVLASESWQRRIDQGKSKNIRPGEVMVVETGSESVQDFAPRLAMAQTVAPPEFRRPAHDFATDDEWRANRELRFDYARGVVTQVLNKTIDALKNDPDIGVSSENPGVIVMPLLLTGPQGTLYEGEAGALYREILDAAAKKHPELVFKIALYDGDRRDNFHTEVVPDFEAQFTGKRALSNQPKAAQGPREAWNAFAASSAGAPGAKPIDAKAVESSLKSLSDNLVAGFKKTAALDRELVSTKLESPSDRRLFWHLHRLAEIPEVYNAMVPAAQRTKHKDADGLQPVTREMIENLMKSPELLKQVFQGLSGASFPPDRVAEAVSLMAAKVLQERRLEVVERNMKAMQAEIAKKNDAIRDLMDELSGKSNENEELSLRLGMAQRKLEQALKNNVGLEAALAEYKAQMAALKGDSRLLGKEKEKLQRQIDRIETAQADRVRSTAVLRASASSESASRSYG